MRADHQSYALLLRSPGARAGSPCRAELGWKLWTGSFKKAMPFLSDLSDSSLVVVDIPGFGIYDSETNTLEDAMSKSGIGRLGMAVLVVLNVVIAASDLAGQFQP